MILSKRILEIQASATLVITSTAKAMKAKGEDVVILAAGEPDFDTPQPVKDAAIKAINDGLTKYTPAGGTKSLKEAVINKLKKDNGLTYEIDQIVISNGAKHSIANILQVLCNTGDEVLIIHPYWVSYPEMVKLVGGIPKIVNTDINNGFRVTVGQIKNSITDKTKVIILNSPSNPAGVVYNEEELTLIAEFCVQNGLFVISDEIYEKILFDDNKHFSIAAVSNDAYNSTIVINGVSKSHSMTGWRIGFAAGTKEIIGKVSTLQSHTTSNPCSISQAAAEFALNADLDNVLDENRIMFEKRRDLILDLLSSEPRIKPFIPAGAFYLFCDISDFGLDSFTFASRLLEEKKVAVIPGAPFGADRFIRISFATDPGTLTKGINRIKEWVNTLG